MIEFKKYRDSLTEEVGPNLTPMIDMMFLLLIFFLLTSFLVRPSIPVALPETESAEVQDQPEMTITIFQDGRLMLEGAIVSEDALSRRLRRLSVSGRAEGIVIQADRGVPFGRVVEIMDLSKKSGVRTISFLVEQKQVR